MKPPIELFDDACLDWGLGPRLRSPRLDAQIYHWREQQAYALIEKEKRRARTLPAIQFGFVDNATLNAAADIREGVGIIGVCYGTVLLTLDFFRRLLSHPMNFQRIGNPASETISRHHAELILPNHTKIMQNRKASGYPKIPKTPNDPIRLAFYEAAAHIACDFVVCHELAHIALGHVGYLLTKLGMPYLVELGLDATSSGDRNRKLTRQIMELDADAGAAALSLNVVNAAKNPHPNFRSVLSSQEQALYLWAVSLTGLFYLWGIEFGGTDLADGHYPPTGHRFNQTANYALDTLKDFNPDLVQVAKAMFPLAFADTMAACQNIGGSLSDKTFFEALSDRKWKQHAQLLNAYRE